MSLHNNVHHAQVILNRLQKPKIRYGKGIFKFRGRKMIGGRKWCISRNFINYRIASQDLSTLICIAFMP
jgi:hypothetical protein